LPEPGPGQTEPMDPTPFIAATEREGAATLRAGRAGLDAAVPTCEGWTVADVLGHLGRVHRSVSEIIERRALEVPPVEIPKPPPGEAVLDFFAEGLERVVAALRSIDPDEPVYSWSGDGTGRFYHRRMAHELAVHRFDVEAAHGTPGPFDPEMATDGIDEFYGVLVPFSARRWKRPLPAGSLHLHRTDGPGEWLVRAVDGSVVTTHEHAKGDVAVKGSASDLFRFVWNRGRSSELVTFGDDAVAEEWAALAP
jgi:uncharacterized protein (TIGR03083 family)